MDFDLSQLLTLKGLLIWILSAGGAGWLASFVLNRWPWYQGWKNDLWKMIFAMVLPGPIAVLAYLVLIAMLYERPPTDTRQWIETLYSVMTAAIAGQLVHKARQDIKRREAEKRG